MIVFSSGAVDFVVGGGDGGKGSIDDDGDRSSCDFERPLGFSK